MHIVILTVQRLEGMSGTNVLGQVNSENVGKDEEEDKMAAN